MTALTWRPTFVSSRSNIVAVNKKGELTSFDDSQPYHGEWLKMGIEQARCLTLEKWQLDNFCCERKVYFECGGQSERIY